MCNDHIALSIVGFYTALYFSFKYFNGYFRLMHVFYSFLLIKPLAAKQTCLVVMRVRKQLPVHRRNRRRRQRRRRRSIVARVALTDFNIDAFDDYCMEMLTHITNTFTRALLFIMFNCVHWRFALFSRLLIIALLIRYELTTSSSILVKNA